MNLLSPISLAPIGWCALISSLLMIAAYFLKIRRRRFEVPFSMLWSRVLKESESSALWKQLRRWLSLLFLLFILGSMTFAATSPHCGNPENAARNIVFVLDSSASMQSVDTDSSDDESRFEVAKKRLISQLNSMGGGDAAMVVSLDSYPRPLSGFTKDESRLKELVKELEVTDTPADLQAALSLAADSLRGRNKPAITIFGDGAYAEVFTVTNTDPQNGAAKKSIRAVDLSGIDVQFESIGQKSPNMGITSFSARRYYKNRLAFEVFVEVSNFGDSEQTRKLLVKSGESNLGSFDISVPPGGRIQRVFTDLPLEGEPLLSALLEKTVEQEDVFPLDDFAYALLPKQKQQRVLLVSDENLYLEGAMLSFDQVAVDRLSPDEYEQELKKGQLPEYDASVFNGYSPKDRPPGRGHALYVAPTGEQSPFPLAKPISAPKLTSLNRQHPVMRWLVLSDTNFVKATPFQTKPGDIILARSIRAAIIAARREGRRKTVALGFSLNETDFVVRVAFPLLLANVLDWFSGDSRDLITTYVAGQRSEVPIDESINANQATLRAPDGSETTVPLVDNQAIITPTKQGIHQLLLGRDGNQLLTLQLAVNLANARESNIASNDSLPLGGIITSRPTNAGASVDRSLWRYLAIFALLLLFVEWFTYHRRITV